MRVCREYSAATPTGDTVQCSSCRILSVYPISGVTGGGRGQSSPLRLLTGKFLLTYREKKRQGKMGKGVKIEKKRRKIVKGKVEN